MTTALLTLKMRISKGFGGKTALVTGAAGGWGMSHSLLNLIRERWRLLHLSCGRTGVQTNEGKATMAKNRSLGNESQASVGKSLTVEVPLPVLGAPSEAREAFHALCIVPVSRCCGR